MAVVRHETRNEDPAPAALAAPRAHARLQLMRASDAEVGRYQERYALSARGSVLGPGVKIEPGARIIESVLLTDTVVKKGAVVARTILDKRVKISENASVGSTDPTKPITMVGKNSVVPADTVVEPGAVINADVVESDYPGAIVKSDQMIDKTRRSPHDL